MTETNEVVAMPSWMQGKRVQNKDMPDTQAHYYQRIYAAYMTSLFMDCSSPRFFSIRDSKNPEMNEFERNSAIVYAVEDIARDELLSSILVVIKEPVNLPIPNGTTVLYTKECPSKLRTKREYSLVVLVRALDDDNSNIGNEVGKIMANTYTKRLIIVH